MSVNYIKKFLEGNYEGLTEKERYVVEAEMSRKDSKIEWELYTDKERLIIPENMKAFYEKFPEAKEVIDGCTDIIAKYSHLGDVTFYELFQKMSRVDVAIYNTLIELGFEIQEKMNIEDLQKIYE